MIYVKVPATSANLGPGFDCLGLALGLYNEFTFSEEGEGLRITGCPSEFCGRDNLAYASYVSTLSALGIDVPGGLSIDIKAEIPVGRGLGSSASLTVAGIIAAGLAHGLDLGKDEILRLASINEGHPDNAAPAVYGGLTAAVIRSGVPAAARYKVSDSLRFTALVPDFEVSTAKARALLPAEIKRQDAVYTIGCLSMLIKGMETGNDSLLSIALDDRLHQPYRKKLIPCFDKIHDAAIKYGAKGLVISGSGSTLLAVGGGEDFADKMKSFLANVPGGWRVLSLNVDSKGAVGEIK